MSEILIPENRIPAGETALLSVVHSINKSNVLGIATLGSFWRLNNRLPPQDIDVGFYVNNDAQFIEEDFPKITRELQQFRLRTEAHIVLPHSCMIKNQVKILRAHFSESKIIWGSFPAWLNQK